MQTFSTPLLADALLRLHLPIRLGPPGLRAVNGRPSVAGRALPVKHYGSVDVFLEAIDGAERGDVLVIDNGGRLDEGCIGDLTALDAWHGGLVGMVVWGAHRDTAELQDIDVAVFSYGSCPSGPRRLDPRVPGDAVHFGESVLEAGDHVFVDADGAVFVRGDDLPRVLESANRIYETERRQAEAIRNGTSLRAQLAFREYLSKRAGDGTYTLRRHLEERGGAIEV